jgi:hypothetical protein
MRAVLAAIAIAICILANSGCALSKAEGGSPFNKALTRKEAVRLAYTELATSASWSVSTAIMQYRVGAASFTNRFAYYSDQKPLVFPKQTWIVILVRRFGGDIIEIYFVHDQHRVVRFK